MDYREMERPPEVDRSVLVVGIDGKVVGLHRTTGEIAWTNPLTGGGHGEVFIAIRYGVLAVSAAGAVIFRLDYATGNTLWEDATSAGGRATILIEPDSIVIAKGGYLDCFDHGGGRRWAQPMRGFGFGRVALGFPGNVAQADDRGSQ